MLEEMLKKLLAKLWDMPQLNLTAENLEVFFQYTNRMNGNITYAKYEAMVTPEDNARLWAIDRSKIQKFLLKWPELVNALENFLLAVVLTWQEAHKSQLGGDALLEIVTEIMPRDKNYLAKLVPLFSFAARMSAGKESSYYFTQLCASACYFLNPETSTIKYEINPEYKLVIDQSKDRVFSEIVAILIAMSNLCNTRKLALSEEIYAILHEQNLHEYDVDEDYSLQEILAARDMQIPVMLENIDEPPFSSNGNLSRLVEDYMVYMELKTAIERPKSSARHKLAEVIGKVRLYQALIEADFKTIMLEPSDEICHFLDIPVSENMIVSLFQAKTKISFFKFNKFSGTENAGFRRRGPSPTSAGDYPTVSERRNTSLMAGMSVKFCMKRCTSNRAALRKPGNE